MIKVINFMYDNRKFCTGDYVMCTEKEYYGITGIVVNQYNPTACEEQTMIETSDGRRFHAPTREFLKLG